MVTYAQIQSVANELPFSHEKEQRLKVQELTKLFY